VQVELFIRVNAIDITDNVTVIEELDIFLERKRGDLRAFDSVN
jgi:hypothetical protein